MNSVQTAPSILMGDNIKPTSPLPLTYVSESRVSVHKDVCYPDVDVDDIEVTSIV